MPKRLSNTTRISVPGSKTLSRSLLSRAAKTVEDCGNMTTHAGMAPGLMAGHNGGFGAISAGFGHGSRAPPAAAPDDDLCFLDEFAAELNGGAYDLGDLLLDDLKLPAAAAPAATDVLVPLSQRHPEPARLCMLAASVL